MNKLYNSYGIRKKLNFFTLYILLGTILIFSIIGAIIIGYNSHTQFVQGKNRIQEALITKGMVLITNNSVALRGIVDDNAFTALREIVVATVKRDSDMVYGIYMDNIRKPWVKSSRDMLFENNNETELMNDYISLWANSLKIPAYRKLQDLKLDTILEFAAPIFSADGSKLGTIRYGVSTLRMRNSIREQFNNSKRESLWFLGFFSIVSALIFFIALQLARRQANTIIRPIETLTNAARVIAQGNYDLPVTALSDDEIGSLSQNFETMRLTIKEYTQNLEKMVADRTLELEVTQKELVTKAHKAGMADIAAGTLHNVGNILNSVKVSVESINSIVRSTALSDLLKANNLLRDNMHRLQDFCLTDSRFEKLMRYYLKLEEPLTITFSQIILNVHRLLEKVNAINDVIAAQQSYTSVGGLSEKVNLISMIEDALLLQSSSLEHHGISIVRDYSKVPEVTVQKTKLIHVFVNLIKNAKESMIDFAQKKRVLAISISNDQETVCIRITDTGCGILPENINKIFSHGFTTKKSGHGFGLHSSANYIKEMGGQIWAESNGLGKGATFVLTIMTKEIPS